MLDVLLVTPALLYPSTIFALSTDLGIRPNHYQVWPPKMRGLEEGKERSAPVEESSWGFAQFFFYLFCAILERIYSWLTRGDCMVCQGLKSGQSHVRQMNYMLCYCFSLLFSSFYQKSRTLFSFNGIPWLLLLKYNIVAQDS